MQLPTKYTTIENFGRENLVSHTQQRNIEQRCLSFGSSIALIVQLGRAE